MIQVFFISLFFAVLIALAAVFVVVRRYSAKNKPVDYPLDQFTRLHLQDEYDRFVGKDVTSRVISSKKD